MIIFAGLLDGFFDVLLDLFHFVVGFLRDFGQSTIDLLLSGVDLIPGSSSWLLAIDPYVDHVNYFFPLDDFIVVAFSLATLWLALFTYRLIKSWIPTVG